MSVKLASMDPAKPADAEWCGHAGAYRTTGFLCGRPASRSDQVVECAECGRSYLASELAAVRRAAAADPADLCKHELLRADCAYCRPKKTRAVRAKPQASAPAPRELRADSAWIEARYPGHCAGCGQQIQPGDEIRRDPDWRGWRGRCCEDV